jgi:hypothetical protein
MEEDAAVTSFSRSVLLVSSLFLISCFALPSAYSQSESKTGAGPRGTPAGPSIQHSQADAPKPPPGMEKSGTPVAKGSSEPASQPSTKPKAQ